MAPDKMASVLKQEKRPPTLKDIANCLGVTVTTVSKAIKDHPDISEGTRKAVKELVVELGYRPNHHAASLKNKKSGLIGLFIPEIASHFFGKAMEGIMAYAEVAGYHVVMAYSQNHVIHESKQADRLASLGVDGVLVSLANDYSPESDHFSLFGRYDIPVVMFDKVDVGFKGSQVTCDEVRSAYLATQHLINSGCQKVAHIRGPLYPSNAIDRYSGYKKALKEADHEINLGYIRVCEEVTRQEGYKFAKQLLTTDDPPDGIFAVTDDVAEGVIAAARELNINVPKQLKVVGFSDSPSATSTDPGITTIRQSPFEMGRIAARELINEIENEDYPKQKIVLSTELVIRGSTRES